MNRAVDHHRRTRRAAVLRAVLLAVLLWAPLARAADPLVVAFDGGCVPTMYVDADGKAAGIYPAIVAAAFAKIGVPVRVDVQPFRRVMAGLDSGTQAGGSVVMTPERQQMALFSAPYFTEKVGAYARAGRAPLRSVADLSGKRIGVIRGWSYGAAFDAARRAGAFKVEEVDSDLANFHKLALGRVDAVLATTTAGELLRRLPEFAHIPTAIEPLLEVPIRLAINRADARRAVLAGFDRAIGQMRASGELDLIASAAAGRAARLRNDELRAIAGAALHSPSERPAR